MAAAERVIPRQPVHDHRRLLRQERHGLPLHHRVAAHRAVGGDHDLRRTGRARRQQESRDGVGTRAPMADVELPRGWRLECAQRRDRTVRDVGVADDLGVAKVELRQCASERRSIERRDHSRREQLDDVAQLAEIRRRQRIGRRHRTVRNTGPQGGIAEHEMLDAIAGQNQDRPLLREISAHEAGRDATDALEQFGVADTLPLAARSTSSYCSPL